MDTNSTGTRVLAIAAGLVFTAGAAGILFEDVLLKGAPLGLKHGITLVVIMGTLMVGHLAHTARRPGFWFLFVIGTGLVVMSSVGRQGENLAVTQATADAAQETRAAARGALKRAQDMLGDAQTRLATECRTGKGKRCDGIRATIAVYEAAARGHQAELDRLGPPKPVAPEAEKLAEIAAVFGADHAKVKAGAVLLQPFLTALFLEFGAIVSFGFGFRSQRKIIPLVETVSKPANDTQLPKDDAEIEKLRAFFVAGDGPVTNDQLAGRMGVSKAEASRRVTKAVEAGLLQRHRLGRNVAIRLN